MITNSTGYPLGWLPDLPDHRDYLALDAGPRRLFRKLPARRSSPPPRVDWREYLPAVDDQGTLPTAAAFAVVAMLQYHERRSSGVLLSPSRLFAHQNACRLLNQSTSAGASLRATLKSIRRFGAPPESLWPYAESAIRQEPPACAYSFERECATLRYLRIDNSDQEGVDSVKCVRSFLAAGWACALGFSVCNSIGPGADIAYPTLYDRSSGGHATIVIGYDDNRRIRSERGAFLLRNSWGAGWGDNGHGWLPYAYLRNNLATDVWTVVACRWLKSGEFQRPCVMDE